ncbi:MULTISPECIES: TonB-dependent hemoglobin/transferrin/lactoferrin family receptor [Methylomicrobium]|uniref:TonB-dependent heme/hemoglobin receptor family protein n=1 Tax=Methylomicrobium album BG8 TaxID=686340 RepID=H8GJ23_METAL|nr:MULTISPECIES: TonB-dependent hemoglobin/transferrin/lactoferrin family receptor [Methylomicrobium]EIC31530.1 TonB-dependent heme/hemoglobin receptor family protein [Methylomicrobium album BG8]
MTKFSACLILSLLAADCAAAAEAAMPESEAESQSEAELESVLVTASRTERGVLDMPGTASVIEAETMERQLARTIKDVVRYEPGVYVQNDPQRFGLSGFNIRGVGGNRIQTLVDGVRIPDAFSIGSFQSARRNMVDVDSLKAVEIVRGPGSALYGSDGIGGVVNFVTKDPRDYLELFGNSHYESLKLLYGSANQGFLQTATLAGEYSGLEGMLLLTHNQAGETENKGSNDSLSRARTEPNPQNARTLNLLSKLLYRFSEDNVLRLTGEALANDVDTQVYSLYGLNYTGRDVYRFLTDDRQNRWRVSLDQSIKHLDLGWLDTLNWKIYGQQSETRQAVDEARNTLLGDNQQVSRLFTYQQSMAGGEIQGVTEFALGPTRHRSVFGGEVFHFRTEALRDGHLADLNTGAVSNVVTPDSFPVRDFPVSDTFRAGLFWQDEMTFWERRVELLPALRFDYFGLRPEVDAIYAKDNKGNRVVDQDATAFSPKFGALFHLNDVFTLHGQYAEGFRAPNFSDANSGFVNFSFGYASIPNPNLKPETSSGGEVGLRAEGRAGYADATFFRNDYQDFIQSETVCDPTAGTSCPPFGLLTYMTINVPDPVRIQGFEFKGELKLSRLWPVLEGFKAVGSYAYAEGWNLHTQAPVNSVNPMRGVLGLGYDAAGGRWGIETILTLAAPKKTQDIDFETAGAVFPTAGYGTVDLLAYCRYTDHVTLNLGLFNIFDKRYIEWETARGLGSDPHAGLGGPVDIRDRFTQPGINVSASLRVEF